MVVVTPLAEAPVLHPWTRGATPALPSPDARGRPFDLGALRGRVVLVQFWASWCEPCREELPALARLRVSMQGRPLKVVTVNLGEGAARIVQYLREVAVDLPVVPDPDRRVGEAWGVGGLPMAFLIDAQGQVRYQVFGACDWTAGEPAAALELLLREAVRAPAAIDKAPPKTGRDR